jgi:hypothetical protein
MGDEDEVERFLQQKLAEQEAVLEGMEVAIEPHREKVRRLRASLAALQTTGTLGSGAVSDDDIIDFLKHNASERKPILASMVADGMSLDTRGLSRRLPRMVKEGLLDGSPETGYWLPASDRVA